MVLGKFPVPGRPTIWIIVGQEPTALSVGVGRGVWTFFSLVYHFFLLYLSLWKTARYTETEILSQRAVNPKPTNQPTD